MFSQNSQYIYIYIYIYTYIMVNKQGQETDKQTNRQIWKQKDRLTEKVDGLQYNTTRTLFEEKNRSKTVNLKVVFHYIKLKLNCRA